MACMRSLCILRFSCYLVRVFRGFSQDAHPILLILIALNVLDCFLCQSLINDAKITLAALVVLKIATFLFCYEFLAFLPCGRRARSPNRAVRIAYCKL
jgi:hypothetical protein